jgi:ribosomal protein L37AE/L43A
MKETAKDIANGVLAILIGNYLLSFFPENVTNISLLSVLNSRLVQFGLSAVLVYLLLSEALTLILDFVRSDPEPHFSSISQRRKPEFVESRYKIERFGVLWDVLYGKKRRLGKIYAYAKDPLCPRCAAELMRDTDENYIRSNDKIWKCPNCSFTQRRPSDFLYEEKEAVEKMAEKEARTQEKDT